MRLPLATNTEEKQQTHCWLSIAALAATGVETRRFLPEASFCCSVRLFENDVPVLFVHTSVQ